MGKRGKKVGDKTLNSPRNPKKRQKTFYVPLDEHLGDFVDGVVAVAAARRRLNLESCRSLSNVNRRNVFRKPIEREKSRSLIFFTHLGTDFAFFDLN